MSTTQKERVEFRVDQATKRLLEDLARSRGVSVGALLRSLVEAQLAELGWEPTTRAEAVQDLLKIDIGPLPAPDALNREIEHAFSSDL